MYNSELWTLTATKEKRDSLHRIFLQSSCLNVRWTQIITNDEAYARSGVMPWSIRIRKRTWNWFGHLVRLPTDSPALVALEHATTEWKRPRGRSATTWITMMKMRFKDIGMSWEDAITTAKDRTEWGHIISTLF